jgi:hypothetical protein
MSFRRRKRLLRMVALGLAAAALGAPASFSYNPHVDEGYEAEGQGPDPAIQGVIRAPSVRPASEARQPPAVPPSSDTFNWIDAGIVAASLVAVVMVAASAGIPLRRLRRNQLGGPSALDPL